MRTVTVVIEKDGVVTTQVLPIEPKETLEVDKALIESMINGQNTQEIKDRGNVTKHKKGKRK